MRIVFETTGRRVTVAHSVAEATQSAMADPPDLLLLDLKLPDGDGLEVARALSARGVTPRATVALTGRDDPESIERCTAAGCAAVLVKPVPTAELLRRAQEWLADTSAPAQS